MQREGNQQPVVVLTQSQQEHVAEQPPVRVLVAMAFLRDLTFKEMPKVAVSDVAIEDIPGMSLTRQETDAKEAAHLMLADYFRGHLDLDRTEQLREQFFTKELNQRVEEGRMLLRCPNCTVGVPSVKCELCRGGGWCTIGPAKGREEK